MRKKIIASLVLAACGSCPSYAGSMGGVGAGPMFKPFVSVEGLYNWPQFTGFSSELATSVGAPLNSSNGWGGRVAAGLMHAMTDQFSISGELGWAYYGHSTLNMSYAVPLPEVAKEHGVGIQHGSFDQWGFDTLIGLYYTQPKYDLYVKAGALFQNLRFDMENFALNSVGGNVSLQTTFPEVMPEIKLGGAYHITQNLVANVAWLYAFGGKFGADTPYIVESPTTAFMGAFTMEVQNPSINAVLFGLEYRFG